MEHKNKEFNIEVGRRIRSSREEAGLTRERLAEYVGITARFLADVECGRVGMSLPNMCKVCQVLGVTTDALLLGKQSRAKTAANQISAMLSGLDPILIDQIVGNIRGQVQLIDLAKDRRDQPISDSEND